MTGRWEGSWYSTGYRGDIYLVLEQRGALVTGEMRTTGVGSTPDPARLSGEVAGNVLSFGVGAFSAEVAVKGSRMSGTFANREYRSTGSLSLQRK